MKRRSNLRWFLGGAALVIMALAVGAPFGVRAVSPEATPTPTRGRLLPPSYPTARPVTPPAALLTPPAVPTFSPEQLTAVPRAFTAVAIREATARAGRTPVPPAPTRTPGPCDDPKPVPPSAETKTYSTGDGRLSLEYPASWSLSRFERGRSIIVNRFALCIQGGFQPRPGDYYLVINEYPDALKGRTIQDYYGTPTPEPHHVITRTPVTIGRSQLPGLKTSVDVMPGAPAEAFPSITWSIGVGDTLYSLSAIYSGTDFAAITQTIIDTVEALK